jgi:hypothetical protein
VGDSRITSGGLAEARPTVVVSATPTPRLTLLYVTDTD